MALAQWCFVTLLAFGLAPGTVSVDAPEVDAARVESGLRARVGDRLEGWRIEVETAEPHGEVLVNLSRPDGSSDARRIEVRGETTDDRSRELAAAIAILVDQYVGPASASAAPSSGSRRARFHLGVGPRLGVGRPADADLGGSFVAGAWLASEHLQPRVQISWSGSRDADLFVHGVRFGAGLAAGAPLARGRLWLGGLVVPHARWVQARDVRVVEAWASSTEVGALLQVRWPHFVLGVRTGADIGLPPLAARGKAAKIRWGTFRYMAGLTLGPRF